MTPRNTLLAAVGVLSTAVLLVSLLADSSAESEHFAFIAFYLIIAAAAARYRLWLGCIVMLSVAVVRGMVSQGVGGFPFQLASTLFAGLVALVVLYPSVSTRKEDTHARARQGTRHSRSAAHD